MPVKRKTRKRVGKSRTKRWVVWRRKRLRKRRRGN